MGFPGGSNGKESACNAGNLGLIPRLGRTPGEWNGYPLQYSCLEYSMDRGAWQATVQGVEKSQTQLNNFHFTSFHRFPPLGIFFSIFQSPKSPSLHSHYILKRFLLISSSLLHVVKCLYTHYLKTFSHPLKINRVGT